MRESGRAMVKVIKLDTDTSGKGKLYGTVHMNISKEASTPNITIQAINKAKQ
jgi:hypothetical protein